MIPAAARPFLLEAQNSCSVYIAATRRGALRGSATDERARVAPCTHEPAKFTFPPEVPQARDLMGG